MNSVILMGRLTSDPEMRYTPSGVANARFTIAVDRPFVGQDKERKADFIRITCWRNTAEFVERYFTKGKPILVQGSIQTGSYQNKDGATVYTTDVVADRVEFVVGDKSSSQGGGSFAPREDKPEKEIPGGFVQLDDDDIPF